MSDQTLNDLFRAQAEKHKGKKRGGLFFAPSLKFLLDKEEIGVHLEKGRGQIFTVMTCFFSSQKTKTICLYPQEYGLIKITTGSNVQDIVLGTSEFDRTFIIQSNNENFARDYLSSFIQERLLAVKRLHPTVKIESGRFTMRIPDKIGNEKDMDAFIAAGIELIRGYRKC